MLPWIRRPKPTPDLAKPILRFSADLSSFSTYMNSALDMLRNMLRNPSKYDNMTAEQIRALLTPRAWGEIKVQAEAELAAEGRVQDRTDQPARITIEPAKLRPKRRIE